MSGGYADDLVREAGHPTGAGTLASPRRHARASNPTCGDEIDLDVEDDGARIADVAHRTRGCAFTRASASLLARAVPGLTVTDALELAATVRRDLAGTTPLPADLAALASVRVYPARIRCALLPWDALRSAFDPMA